MNEIPVEYKNFEKRKTFWDSMLRDSMDLYSLATALYVFVVILPIVLAELKRPKTRFITLKFFDYEFGEIPGALQIVLISVILTTGVNYFRLILNVVLHWLKKKLKIDKGV